ncbi:hypothetical protein BC941DRAFT_477109 [Chlamydoabsidia padenii]|nr:hypothetical protein BC941DRAFT_477109 [Chlamydoabsidia padenii]
MDIGDIEEGAGFRADKNIFTSGKRKRDEEKLGLASIELDTEFGPYYNQVIMMQIAENDIREPALNYQSGKDEEITALIKEKLAKGVEKLDADLLKCIFDHPTLLYQSGCATIERFVKTIQEILSRARSQELLKRGNASKAAVAATNVANKKYLGKSRNLQVDRIVYILATQMINDYRWASMRVNWGAETITLKDFEEDNLKKAEQIDNETGQQMVQKIDDSTFS